MKHTRALFLAAFAIVALSNATMWAIGYETGKLTAIATLLTGCEAIPRLDEPIQRFDKQPNQKARRQASATPSRQAAKGWGLALVSPRQNAAHASRPL